jgi:hypothetical protein
MSSSAFQDKNKIKLCASKEKIGVKYYTYLFFIFMEIIIFEFLNFIAINIFLSVYWFVHFKIHFFYCLKNIFYFSRLRKSC